MVQVAKLHQIIAGRIEYFDDSYRSFYKKVLNGELRYKSADETCMTR
jgi:hypothetical protein